MNHEYTTAAAVVVSSILLLFTGHPAFFVALVAGGVVFGWVAMKHRVGDAAEG